MSATHHVPDLSGERIELGDAGDAVSRAAYGLGVVGLVATGFLGSGGGEEGWRRAMLSYLQKVMGENPDPAALSVEMVDRYGEQVLATPGKE